MSESNKTTVTDRRMEGSVPAPSGESQAARRTERVKALAREQGFDLVGIAPPETGVAHDRYQAQMGAGYGAEMAWLHEQTPLRRDVRAVHSEARSVIALGVGYWSATPGYLESSLGPDEGWIARYAQGLDYHHDVRKMAIGLARAMAADPMLGYPSEAHRVFVDTGPLLEKALANHAGLGWVAKNTLLINREWGSWLFLAMILTPLELIVDQPGTDHCGSCTRCLDACPTDAFPTPYVLDARKCIATWTIESAAPTEVVEPELLGQHVFGCDICQEVCPWNRTVPETHQEQLAPRPENIGPNLAELATLDEAAFRKRFPRSAVRRSDAARMADVVALIREREKKKTRSQ